MLIRVYKIVRNDDGYITSVDVDGYYNIKRVNAINCESKMEINNRYYFGVLLYDVYWSELVVDEEEIDKLYEVQIQEKEK